MLNRNSLFSKIKQTIIDNFGFFIVLCIFSIIFFAKLFTNVLHVDEVGFYLSPTSRGVAFSLLSYGSTGHHILYATLSAILDLLGNVYIAIRGVPFIAWLLSNIVIYKTCLLKCKKNSSVLAVLIYDMLYCTNFYAVGGRGYMLINLCFALAVYFSMRLTEDMHNRKLWIGFIVANICGFWTITTYMYAFFCIVIAWGLYLLINKRYSDIWKLFKYCVCIAICVFLVYCPVFLFVHVYDLAEQGLIEKSNRVFVETIIREPFACLIGGMSKVIETTAYFMDKKTVGELLNGLWDHLGKISSYVFFRPFPALSRLCYLGIWLLSVVYCFMKKGLCYMYGAVALVFFVPIMFIQSLFPFERLFTYLGVVIAISIAHMLEQTLQKRIYTERYIGVALAALAIVLYLHIDYINPQHDTYDDSVEMAIEQIPSSLLERERLTVYVDSFQQRNYMILWGRMNEINIEFVEDNPELAIVSAENRDIISEDGLENYYSDAYIVASAKE